MTPRSRLGIQLTLSDGYETDPELSALLAEVAACGLSELELNIADPARVDPARLQAFLSRFGLSLTRLATGLAARVHGFSLSSEDSGIRRRSIDACGDMIRYAAAFQR
ncbi:MAG: hypothetical protein ABSG85_03865 [Spirochaetia bacterium]|jgi:sugar phosphate isomerase/epimerase